MRIKTEFGIKRNWFSPDSPKPDSPKR